MAHTAKNPTLGRKKGPKKALFTQLMNQLLVHRRIRTTLPKAKALARRIAAVITHARKWSNMNSMHAYRHAFAVLRQKETVKLLFEEIVPKVGTRPGGYTRVLALGRRAGDRADMGLIELVDFNTLLQKKTKAKTRRGSRKKFADSGQKNASNQVPKTTHADAAKPKGVQAEVEKNGIVAQKETSNPQVKKAEATKKKKTIKAETKVKKTTQKEKNAEDKAVAPAQGNPSKEK